MQLTVCLDRVRSAYNVGSVFRSSDSAGFTKIYLCGYCVLPPDHKLEKTALGAQNAISWEHHCKTIELIRLLKREGVYIVGFETADDAVSLFDFRLPTKKEQVCLVFGNEVTGLEADVLAECDAVVAIPHFGHKSSLNIASAAAVAMYELKRQLTNRKK
jgi:tRNA G18 (ribose-2'-O)-methylase SpoU